VLIQVGIGASKKLIDDSGNINACRRVRLRVTAGDGLMYHSSVYRCRERSLIPPYLCFCDIVNVVMVIVDWITLKVLLKKFHLINSNLVPRSHRALQDRMSKPRVDILEAFF
jgi:hypothetical protein